MCVSVWVLGFLVFRTWTSDSPRIIKPTLPCRVEAWSVAAIRSARSTGPSSVTVSAHPTNRPSCPRIHWLGPTCSGTKEMTSSLMLPTCFISLSPTRAYDWLGGRTGTSPETVMMW